MEQTKKPGDMRGLSHFFKRVIVVRFQTGAIDKYMVSKTPMEIQKVAPIFSK